MINNRMSVAPSCVREPVSKSFLEGAGKASLAFVGAALSSMRSVRVAKVVACFAGAVFAGHFLAKQTPLMKPFQKKERAILFPLAALTAACAFGKLYRTTAGVASTWGLMTGARVQHQQYLNLNSKLD
jgi:hypothetical protein